MPLVTTLLVNVLACGTIPGLSPDLRETNADRSVWPNVASAANSDPWLVEHHDQIRRMEPRVLVINFCNRLARRDIDAKVQELIAALAESSRYHGYESRNAPVFLQYRVAKIVDLSDAEPGTTVDGNSTRYPRVPNWKAGINFEYRQLHTEAFAKLLDFRDPSSPKRCLRLDELLQRGVIHELWFLAFQRDAGSPFECTEQKPVYDEHFRRHGDQHRHAGNGGDVNEPWYDRSLRITFINAERGIGCAMESLGHGIESMANAEVIPYFTKYFREYADFMLDENWRLPVDSLYAVDAGGHDKASYPDASTMVVHHAGKDYRVPRFVANGGSVHFPPNGRRDYDLDNAKPVRSTIEHWRRFDGKNGRDICIDFTNDRFQRYQNLAPDCMGPWLVYWRQNMPGLDNRSLDDQRRPMKNWWVFLFY